jgi:hypothetical protein
MVTQELPRYKVLFYGSTKTITTVRATNEKQAVERVAASRKLDAVELRAERIRQRVDVTCGHCGWTFKTPERDRRLPADDHYVRCTLCQAEGAMQARARDFLWAQKKFQKLLAKRAEALNTEPEELEQRLYKRG